MYLILFLIGMLIGIFVSVMITRDKPSGNFIVDDTDSDGPFIFLEATESVESIIAKKKVTLIVDHRRNNKASNERS